MINFRKIIALWVFTAFLSLNFAPVGFAQSDVKSARITEENINDVLSESMDIVEYLALSEDQSAITTESRLFDPLENEIMKASVEKTGLPQKIWLAVKGRRDKSSLQLGMWSKHLSSSRYNETHNLGALQYKGYWAGTFTNSHDDQVFFIGVARNLARKKFGKNMVVDFGYKIGPMYGYKQGIPEVGGFSILPVMCIDTSYRDVGVTLNLFPSAAVSFNTYINLDILRHFKKKRKKKI